MANQVTTLQQRVRGIAEPGRIAAALVGWMVEADLGEDLIDQERSRHDPTIDAGIVDRLPKSLVHKLTKGPGDGWAVGTPPATESQRPHVADDGTVRTWFPARSEWEIRHDSVGAMLLEDVLHWIRLYSPAARRFEFDPDDGPRTPEGALALHQSVNHRISQVVFDWFVVDSAVLFVHADAHGAPAIEVLGRRGSEVETVEVPHAVWSEWKSVEHAMEVDTDNWTAPDHAFPGVTGAVVGRDLVAEVASAPPVTAFHNFLRVWFGAEPTTSSTTAGGRPIAIETALTAGLELYRDAHLEDPTAEHQFDGPPNSFLAECQFLWQAGYYDGADPDPQVVLRIDQEPQGESVAEFTVAQMLLRVLLDEVSFCSPVTGTATWVDQDLLATALRELHPFAALPGFATPAYTDGKVLVIPDGFGVPWGSPSQLRFAAHAREDIVASSVGRLPRLTWSYPDDRRTRSPGDARIAEQMRGMLGGFRFQP